MDTDDEEIPLQDAIAVLMRAMGCTPQQAADEMLRLWRDGKVPIIAREVPKVTND